MTTVTGQVILPDLGSPAGLAVSLHWAERAESASVDQDGIFRLRVTGDFCDDLQLRIDSVPGRPRQYHRAVVRFSTRDVGSAPKGVPAIRVVLVPTHFRIEAGNYAGTVVPIDVGAALTDQLGQSRYWRASRSMASGDGIPVGWPEDRLPIPVSIAGLNTRLAAETVAAFWTIAHRLEGDIGRPLFRRAAVDAPDDEWRIEVSVRPGSRSAGSTFITYDGHGTIYDAKVDVRSVDLLSDSRVVTHELLHTLGFGHSSTWHSVMSPPHQASQTATPRDIAYAQLLMRLRRSHIAGQATHGFLTAVAEAGRVPAGGAQGECQ